jgi:hypothetical protein
MAKIEGNKTRIFLYSSVAAAAGFLIIALLAIFYGVKMYHNRLLTAADANGKALQASLFLVFLMIIYVVLAALQLKF